MNESLKPGMAPLEADEDAWYSRLREQWKPSQVRLLMIAESAPDDGGGDEAQRRFFDLFAMLVTPLVTADLPLLHKAPIPFPLGNTRAAFIEGFNRARSRLD